MLAATKSDMLPFEPLPSHHSWPLFHQDWWLDATAPSSWRRPVAESPVGSLAAFPFVIRRRYGLTALTVPPLTPYLGPWIRRPEDTALEPATDDRLLDRLIESLPPHDVLYSRFHPSISNWLSFPRHGFRTTTRYSYRLRAMHDSNTVWRTFSAEHRRLIRQAERTLIVRTDLPVDAVRRFDTLFERSGLPNAKGYELLARIDLACHTRDQGRLLVVEDRVGRIHAGAYVVWDDDTAYVILAGGPSAARDSIAWNLLIWEAIRFLAPATTTIDFTGAVPEEMCWAVDAERVPYLVVTSNNRRARLVERVRRAAFWMSERKQGQW